MKIKKEGTVLSYESRMTKEKKPFYISRVFIPEAEDVAEVFSNTDPYDMVGTVVDLVINVQLSGEKKVSCNFAF